MFVHLFPSRPIRHIRCDLTSRADSSVTPGARRTSVVAGRPCVFLDSLIKTSDLTSVSDPLCLSFYLFISNPAPFPLPPSSLHSLNFVPLLCPPCCRIAFFSFLSPGSSISFSDFLLFWLVRKICFLASLHLPLPLSC